MPTPAQTLDVSSAIANIRSAQQALDSIMATTGDSAVLSDLTATYRELDHQMTLLLAAQNAADDTAFAAATASLKARAGTLKDEEARVQKTVGKIAMAAHIVGYIAQAVTLIAAL